MPKEYEQPSMPHRVKGQYATFLSDALFRTVQVCLKRQFTCRQYAVGIEPLCG